MSLADSIDRWFHSIQFHLILTIFIFYSVAVRSQSMTNNLVHDPNSFIPRGLKDLAQDEASNSVPSLRIDNSDSLDIEWEKTFVPPDKDYYNNDIANVIVDKAGNFYMCGTTWSTPAGADILLTKYDAQRHIIWQRIYNGELSGHDQACKIMFDHTGNLLVIGQSFYENSSCDFLLLKYDPDGQLLQKSHFGSKNYDYYAYAALDSAGNLVVAGTFEEGNQKFLLIDRVNDNGQLIWQKTYLLDDELFYSARFRMDSSGRIYAVFENTSSGISILMIDYYGILKWKTKYSLEDSLQLLLSSCSIDTKKNLVVVGIGYSQSSGFPNGQMILITSFDPKGFVIRQKRLQAKGNFRIFKVLPLIFEKEGNFNLLFKEFSNDTSQAIEFTKFDSDWSLLQRVMIDSTLPPFNSSLAILNKQNDLLLLINPGNYSYDGLNFYRIDTSGQIFTKTVFVFPDKQEAVSIHGMFPLNDGALFYFSKKEYGKRKIGMALLNPDGEILWSIRGGEKGVVPQHIVRMSVTSQGNIYLVTSGENNNYCSKFNSGGHLLWVQSDTLKLNSIIKMTQSKNENLYILSLQHTLNLSLGKSFILKKITADGQVKWQSTWSPNIIFDTYYLKARLYVDKNENVYVLIKIFNYEAANSKVYLLKYTDNGELEGKFEYTSSMYFPYTMFLNTSAYVWDYTPMESDSLSIVKFSTAGIEWKKMAIPFSTTFGTQDLFGNLYTAYLNKTEQDTSYLNIIKINKQGEIIRIFKYPLGFGSKYLISIAVNRLGKIYITYRDSVVHLIAFESNGTVSLQKTLGDPTLFFGRLQFDYQDNIYIKSMKILSKFDSGGHLKWTLPTINKHHFTSFIGNVYISLSGTIYLSTESYNFPYWSQVSVMKINQTYPEKIVQTSPVQLFENYPNPFNNVTIISFSLNKEGPVEFIVYNILGQAVLKRKLGYLKPEKYWLQFNSAGTLATGMYFYQIKLDHFTQTRRMLYLK